MVVVEEVRQHQDLGLRPAGLTGNRLVREVFVSASHSSKYGLLQYWNSVDVTARNTGLGISRPYAQIGKLNIGVIGNIGNIHLPHIEGSCIRAVLQGW